MGYCKLRLTALIQRSLIAYCQLPSAVDNLVTNDDKDTHLMEYIALGYTYNIIDCNMMKITCFDAATFEFSFDRRAYLTSHVKINQ